MASTSTTAPNAAPQVGPCSASARWAPRCLCCAAQSRSPPRAPGKQLATMASAVARAARRPEAVFRPTATMSGLERALLRAGGRTRRARRALLAGSSAPPHRPGAPDDPERRGDVLFASVSGPRSPLQEAQERGVQSTGEGVLRPARRARRASDFGLRAPMPMHV